MVSKDLYLILFLLAFQCPSFMSAQSNEALFSQLDRPFYVVGDDISCKIYLLSNSAASSQIVHAELLSPEGNVLIRQNLKVTDKTACGNFKIPLNWEEGNYLFRVYTLWQTDSTNATKACIFKKTVSIYNDFTKRTTEGNAVFVAAPAIESTLLGGFKIENQGKTTFERRDKVQLSFKVFDNQGQAVEANLSASVIEYTPLSTNDILETFQETQSNLQRNKAISFQNMQPETQLTVLGKVKDPQNEKPITDSYLSLYIPKQRKFLRLTATEGLFKTNIDAFNDKTEVQILSLNPNRNYPLVIESIYNIGLPNYKAASRPVRTPEVEKYLQLNPTRRRIHDIFDPPSLPSKAKDTTAMAAAYQPDKSYNMKNYTDMNTVEDFVREIMLNCQVTTINNVKTVRLNNKDESKLYNFAPWYLIDGLFVSDEEAALKLPLNGIEKIDVFNRKKTIEDHFDWLMFRYGVIAITTNKKMRLPSDWTFRTAEVAGFSSLPNRTTPSVSDTKIPDFRPLLTWQSQLKTDKTGTGLLTFTTSDIKGKHAVRIMGVSKDNKPIFGIFYIDVK